MLVSLVPVDYALVQQALVFCHSFHERNLIVVDPLFIVIHGIIRRLEVFIVSQVESKVISKILFKGLWER